MVKYAQENGHEVVVYECTNDENVFNKKGHKLKSFYYSTWNPFAYKKLRTLLKEHQPDIMHVHNYWYQLSPSIFKAAYDHNVPSVITLHNYRLLCPGVLFLRNGDHLGWLAGSPHTFFKLDTQMMILAK